MDESTLILLKPDTMLHGHGPAILDRFRNIGFDVPVYYQAWMDDGMIEQHYGEKIQERPGLADSLRFSMNLGPVLAAVVRGPNVVAETRRMMGSSWRPDECLPGEIRYDFAQYPFLEGGPSLNMIHGSDSVENSSLERKLWFDNFLDRPTMGVVTEPTEFLARCEWGRELAKRVSEVSDGDFNAIYKLSDNLGVTVPVNSHETTLVLLHADAFSNGANCALISRLHKEGMVISGAYRAVPNHNAIAATYEPVLGDGFEAVEFSQLVHSTPVSVLAITGDQAKQRVYDLVGESMDPAECGLGTIRGKYRNVRDRELIVPGVAARHLMYASRPENAAADLTRWFDTYKSHHFNHMRREALK